MTVNQPGQYPERFVSSITTRYLIVQLISEQAMGNHPEGDPYEHITKHYVVPAMEEAFHFGAVEFDP